MKDDSSNLSMLELFRVEAENQTAHLTSGLLELERGPASAAQLESLMRAAHSLKGAARIVNLPSAVRVAHAMEDCFVAAQQGQLELRQPHIDLLLRGVDLLALLNSSLGVCGESGAGYATGRANFSHHSKKQLASWNSTLGGSPESGTGISTGQAACADEQAPKIEDFLVAFARLMSLRAVGCSEPEAVPNEVLGTKFQAPGPDTLPRGIPRSEAAVSRDMVIPRGEHLTPGTSDSSHSPAHLPHLSERQHSPRGITPASVGTDAVPSIPRGEALGIGSSESVLSRDLVIPMGEATDRVLRLTAENLNRLLGLAGESLVESRWLRPFSESMQRFKRMQSDLERTLDGLRQSLNGENLSESSQAQLNELFRQAAETRQFLGERLQELDLFDRRSVHLSNRLYLEVLRTRMRPFGDGTRRFPRMVRDLARSLGKQVRLEIAGENTQIDRDILDRLETPLAQLLRNALDHGCEKPEERERAGKPPEGTIRVEARHNTGMLIVTVSDDGAGLDVEVLREKLKAESRRQKPGSRGPFLLSDFHISALTEAELLQFLFLPGFTMRDSVTELSGRGVGLDIVQNIVKSLRGSVRVEILRGEKFEKLKASPSELTSAYQTGDFSASGINQPALASAADAPFPESKGSNSQGESKNEFSLSAFPPCGMKFQLQLPLTMSILRTLLVEVGGSPRGIGLDAETCDRLGIPRGELYAFPLAQIAQTLRLPRDKIEVLEGRQYFQVRGAKCQVSGPDTSHLAPGTLEQVGLLALWNILSYPSPRGIEGLACGIEGPAAEARAGWFIPQAEESVPTGAGVIPLGDPRDEMASPREITSPPPGCMLPGQEAATPRDSASAISRGEVFKPFNLGAAHQVFDYGKAQTPLPSGLYAAEAGSRTGSSPPGQEAALEAGTDLPILVLGDHGTRYGLLVDRFLGERELVVQPLDPRLGKVKDFSAAALLEDGSPVLIVDVDNLMCSIEKLISPRGTGGSAAEARPVKYAVPPGPSVMDAGFHRASADRFIPQAEESEPTGASVIPRREAHGIIPAASSTSPSPREVTSACETSDSSACGINQPALASAADPPMPPAKGSTSRGKGKKPGPKQKASPREVTSACQTGDSASSTSQGESRNPFQLSALPRRKRILAVDDSLAVRELERKLLTSRGYLADVAVDGVDGWNAVRNLGPWNKALPAPPGAGEGYLTGQVYDLVITDVDMPRMDGIELARLIKRDPQLKSLPVMIVSYKDREEDRLRGLEAGADYYFTKGNFHDEQLLQAVAELIGSSCEISGEESPGSPRGVAASGAAPGLSGISPPGEA